MKLLVKTLKGEKFHVECEPTQTVLEVKGIIVSLLLLVAFVVVVVFVSFGVLCGGFYCSRGECLPHGRS